MYLPDLVKFLNIFLMGSASGFKRILIFILLTFSGLKRMSQIALNSLGIQFFRSVASIHFAAKVFICGNLK